MVVTPFARVSLAGDNAGVTEQFGFLLVKIFLSREIDGCMRIQQIRRLGPLEGNSDLRPSSLLDILMATRKEAESTYYSLTIQ